MKASGKAHTWITKPGPLTTWVLALCFMMWDALGKCVSHHSTMSFPLIPAS